MKGGRRRRGLHVVPREKPTSPRAGPTAATAVAAATSCSRPTPRSPRSSTTTSSATSRPQRGTARQGRDPPRCARRRPRAARCRSGTVVRDAETGELLGDLAHPGQRVVVARGRPRRTRQHPLRDADAARARRSPSSASPPRSAGSTLEMKLLADAALVGMPSVGKSSLIARMTRRAAQDRRLPVHDARAEPRRGEGGRAQLRRRRRARAHRGRAARARASATRSCVTSSARALILHVVDLSGGYEGARRRRGLRGHRRASSRCTPTELAERPRIVVGNKIDVAGRRGGLGAAARRGPRPTARPYFAVSARHRRGRRRAGPRRRRAGARAAARSGRDRGGASSGSGRHEPAATGSSPCATSAGGVFEVDRPRRRAHGHHDRMEQRGGRRLPAEAAGQGGRREGARRRPGAVDGDEVRIAGRTFDVRAGVTRDPEVVYIEDEPTKPMGRRTR